MKKFVSGILALAMVAATAVSSVASADSEIFANFSLMDCDDIITKNKDYSETFVGIDEELENCLSVYGSTKSPAYFHLSDESEENLKDLADRLNEISDRFVVVSESSAPMYGLKFAKIYVKGENGELESVNTSDVKVLCEIFKDKIANCDYSPESIRWEKTIYEDNMSQFEVTAEQLSVLKDYLKNSGISAEIDILSEKSNYFQEGIWIKLNYDKALSGMDCFDTANKIAKDTGIKPLGFTEQFSLSSSTPKINIAEFVNGDTNEDGDLTIADSVAVLQFIGNPDKYALTAQAEFNADVDGIDGITGADAFVIQQMELGIK